MGGDVHAAIATEVEVGRAQTLGKGFVGHVVTAPNGRTFIVESETGAIVGWSLEQVRSDIEKAEYRAMQLQITEAKEKVRTATYVSEQEFWKRMGMVNAPD
jgi:hypothetical protein